MANLRALRQECFLVTALYVAAGFITIAACEIATASQAAASGAVCDSAEPAWTARERWVWGQVCRRRPAVLSDGANVISAQFLKTILLDEPYRSALHSRVEIVGASFPRELDLSDATIPTSLLLDQAHFAGPVYFARVDMRGISLAGAHFADGLSFDDAKISGSIDLRKAITKCIDLSGIDVANNVILSSVRAGYGGRSCPKDFEHGDVLLIHARVGLDFRADHAKTGSVDGSHADVRGGVDMTGGLFGAVSFAGAQVGAHVDLTGSTARDLQLSDLVAQDVVLSRESSDRGTYIGPVPIFGDISLERAHLKSGFFVAGVATGDIDAPGIEVVGDVSLADAIVGKIDLSSARVDGRVVLTRATSRAGLINLSGGQFGTFELIDSETDAVRAGAAAISHDLVVKDSSLAALDLTATKVDGNFFLRRSHDAPIFRSHGGLVLRNASVHAFEDRAAGCLGFGPACPDPWPAGCSHAVPTCQRLDLNGFTYTGFAFMGRNIVPEGELWGSPPPRRSEGALGEDGRDIGWWKDWLGREAYSPQPYQQLASALRAAGRFEDAVAIEYAGKDREYDTAPFTRKVFLVVDRWLVGYGYHPGYAIWFAAALVLIGVIVVRRSGQDAQLARTGEPLTVSAFVYSFDMLIPLITLRDTDAKADFTGWPGYYFFAQKIAGYVLATFLVAGISGLTK